MGLIMFICDLKGALERWGMGYEHMGSHGAWQMGNERGDTWIALCAGYYEVSVLAFL